MCEVLLSKLSEHGSSVLLTCSEKFPILFYFLKSSLELRNCSCFFFFSLVRNVLSVFKQSKLTKESSI